MTVLLIILAVLGVFILISLLRAGVTVEYSEGGFKAWLRIGFLSFGLYPPKKEKKVKKPRVKKEKKPKKPKVKKEPMLKKPGSLKEFLDMLAVIKEAFSRLRRKLLIKRLVIHYTAAGSDPMGAALAFGASNAVFSSIVPLLEKYFKIRNRDFRTLADFESEQQKIYVNAAVSMAVWEGLYVIFALRPLLSASQPQKSRHK